jgi:hypothetical protein
MRAAKKRKEDEANANSKCKFKTFANSGIFSKLKSKSVKHNDRLYIAAD